MRTQMCAYANCENDVPTERGFKLTITESWRGNITEQKCFCCREHAWEWLRAREARLAPRSIKEDDANA